MNKIIVVWLIVLTIIVVIGAHFRNYVYEFFIINWSPILVATIGGTIGGLIVYCYVTHIENKKEQKRTRQECTKALLATQMALSLQMADVVSLKEIAEEIVNFGIEGKTFKQHFDNLGTVFKRAQYLSVIINEQPKLIEKILPLTNYVVTSSAVNNIVSLPYIVFDLSTEKLLTKGTKPDMHTYFQGLASCNGLYSKIHHQIQRINSLRDLFINQPVSINEEGVFKCCYVVAGIFTQYCEVLPIVQTNLV